MTDEKWIVERRGRVVKSKRRPIHGAQKKLGENGICLIEYIGDSNKLVTFSVMTTGGQADYEFSNRPASRLQLIDKAHADYLLTLRGDNNQPLFKQLAAYAAGASLDSSITQANNDGALIPSELLIPDDGLPSGFAGGKSRKSRPTKINLDDVAVALCNYRSKSLTEQAYNSFREFYPEVLVYLVDNGSQDESTEYINNLIDSNLITIINPVNYGHGGGLHQVAEMCEKPFLFTLDSDTITHKGGFLELMLAEFAKDKNTYAVGYECETDENGYNTYTGHNIRYIHPMYSMYKLSMYRTLRPFLHHGAPCIHNMIDANVRGLRLVHLPIDDYIEHLGGGTSKIAGGWSPNVKPLIGAARLPYVSFITRCYKRPRGLLRCMTSISRQTDPDYENVLIVDENGIGVEGANASYNKPYNLARVHGQYIHLIDDDDIICDPHFVATIKNIAENNDRPEVIIIRVRHPNGSIMPTADMWMGKEPVPCHIGGSSVVVRRDVWMEHIHYFGDDQVYYGDFVFITELFKLYAEKMYWLNRVMVEVPKQSKGDREDWR